MTPPFIHPQALCESTHVGAGTRVWAFAHVLPNARIGADCNLCDGVFVENDVEIGDRVTVKCGVQLWDGVRLEDDVFVGPNATFTNDRLPRSKRPPSQFAVTLVKCSASIGANATILPGVTIGRFAIIGAGAVVTSSVPPYAIVVGNPARIVGYAESAEAPPLRWKPGSEPAPGAVVATPVEGVTLHQLVTAGDLRGKLAAGEFGRQIPFEPKRFFVVHDVPSERTRGQHAHRRCHQFLLAASGRLAVVVDDGEHRCEIALEDRGQGLYIRPLVWSIQYRYTADATLLVFASDFYDPDDYIRDYESFLVERRARAGAAG